MADDELKTATDTATDAEPAPDSADESAEEIIPFERVDLTQEEGAIQRYKVTAPREKFDAISQDLLKELRRNVSVEGFRKGKAPIKLLQIRYGKEVQQDALRQMGANIADQIIQQDELDVVGEPEMHDSAVEDDKPVELTLDIEARPKVDIQDYKNLEVEIVEEKVAEDAVDQQLEQLRQQNAQFRVADAGAEFNIGDAAVVDFEILDENGAPVENLCRRDQFMRNPEQELPPKFAEKIVGMKASESIEEEVETEQTTKSGQEVTRKDTHRVTLKEIQIVELPELDDEFAKDLGEFDTLKDLRERIETNLKQRAENEERQRALNAIHDKILEANEFEAPRTMVGNTTMRMVQETGQRLAMMGMNFESLGEEGQRRYIQGAREDARRNVRIQIALAAIADKEGVEADDADVDKAIEEVAESEGRRPLAIRARLERERRLDELKNELRLRKVNDMLVDSAKIKKTEPKPEEEEPQEDPPPTETPGESPIIQP